MEKIKEIRVQKSFRLKESTIHMLNRINGKNDTEKVEYCIDKTYNLTFKEEIEFPFCLEITGLDIVDSSNLLNLSLEQLEGLDLSDEKIRKEILNFDIRKGNIFNIEDKKIGFELLEQFELNASTNIQEFIKGLKTEKINLGITEEIAQKLRKEFDFFRSSKKESVYNYGPFSEQYIKIEKTETDQLVFTPDKEKIIELILSSVVFDNIIIKNIEENLILDKNKVIAEQKEKALVIEENIILEEEENIKNYKKNCLDYLHMLKESCNDKENRIALLLASTTDTEVIQNIAEEYYSYYRVKEIITEQKQSYSIDKGIFNTLKLVEHAVSGLNMNELKAYTDIKNLFEADENFNKFYNFKVMTGFKEVSTINFNNSNFDKTITSKWFNESDKYFILECKLKGKEFINVIKLTNWFTNNEKK